MKQEKIKSILSHFSVILFFAILSITYFSPVVFNGEVIRQGDVEQFEGMAKELNNYRQDKNNKDIIAWQGNMFSGMPSYHTTVVGVPENNLSFIGKAMSLLDYSSVRIVFVGLVCFYILMCVIGANRWLAIAGSIAFAFASYNFVILEAGHITKAYVIAYMPLAIAGMSLLFREKWLWGVTLFTLGVAMSLFENHMQITYYLMLLCFFLYLGYAYQQIKEKKVVSLLKTSAIMAACVCLAVLPNAGNMYGNLEMSKSSTRGATELTTKGGDGEKISSGLDKDYAFQWSYGKTELLTLLIPNAYGGSTGGTLGPDSELYKELKGKGAQVGKDVQTYTYWGDKSFTSGPVYLGALVCFLFVLGLFWIRNPFKWWLLAGASFLTLLALGRNLDWFNDFMFHHLPMYNKFRTVEMALVIPGFVAPILAIWGLKDFFANKIDDKLFKKGMLWSLGLTGGLCLIVWWFPSLLLGFQSSFDAQYQMPDWYYSALLSDRKSIASADAFRSLIFILLGAGSLFWYFKARNKKNTAALVSIVIAFLILGDLWSVDKRYLNDSNFVRAKAQVSHKESAADKLILEDKDPSYRVINLNNPFQEANTSYYHKSVGGYHAAKLRRYQELIDHRLAGELTSIIQVIQNAKSYEEVVASLANCPSLNMLNTRYIIYNPDQPPMRNPYAFGNAWFVEKIHLVENPDAEIATLNTIDPKETAVVDKRFANDLAGFTPQKDSSATIRLENYRPNRLTYISKAATEQLAVFSEIYYQPGWKVTVDGKPATHFRADWTLRAMRIPAGEHQVVFEFYPDNYVLATKISTYSSLVILLLLLGAIAYSIWKEIRKGSTEIKKAAK